METASKILYEGGQGEIIEKKSRFIANIFPVTTEEEALEKITAMRKKYHGGKSMNIEKEVQRLRDIEAIKDLKNIRNGRPTDVGYFGWTGNL